MFKGTGVCAGSFNMASLETSRTSVEVKNCNRRMLNLLYWSFEQLPLE